MKIQAKAISIVFFSILMLVPVGLPHSEALGQADTSKFDPGFYEAIKEKIAESPTTRSAGPDGRYHSVIIVTGDKEGMVRDLTDNFGAQNIFNPEHLGNVVTADVPANLVLGLSSNPDVIKLGDGELELESLFLPFEPDNPDHISILQAKEMSGWSSNITETGIGVTFGLVDASSSYSHDDLPDSKIIERVDCMDGTCSTVLSDRVQYRTHSNHAASLMSGSGESNSIMRGIAPDSKIRLAITSDAVSRVSGLDYLLGRGVDIIVSIASVKVPDCNPTYTVPPAIALIVDGIVNDGISVIAANGNDAEYTLAHTACSYNGIGIGNMEKDGNINFYSSRGGITGFINPSLSAIGTNVAGASTGTDYVIKSGTSFAAPMVGGAAALLLDRNPELSPNEIRTALLLGSAFNHQGNVTGNVATASDYEGTAHPTLVSYMNDFGFGILHMQNSLDLVADGVFPYVISDTVTDDSDSKLYRIYAHSGDDVKILMSWNLATIGPSGQPVLAQNATSAIGALKNYQMEVTRPDGSKITSDSAIQNTEFAYFTADADGYYEIRVTADSAGLNHIGYALGSNHPLDSYPFNDELPAGDDAPACGANEICKLGNVASNDTAAPVITLNGYNPQTVPLNEEYTEYSGTADDADDHTYTGTVSIDDASLDTTRPGVYTITYTAPADQAGNTPVPQNRTVIVFDPEVNLVQNGSFEAPALSKSWGTYDQVNPWAIHWNAHNPNVVHENNMCPTEPLLEIQTSRISGSLDGRQFAELDSHCTALHNTSVTISQDVATEPDQEYTVSFASKKRTNTSDDSNGLQISADGIVLGTITGMDTAWQRHTVQFTAQDDATTISFADVGAPDTYGTLLDSISVTKTGETANLVQNGSFEGVTVSSNQAMWQLFESDRIPGWSVSWNRGNPSASSPACPVVPVVEIQKGVSGGADSGANHAELDTHCHVRFYTSVAISQTISTVHGAQYELSWHSHDRPGTEESTNGLDILLNGQKISGEQLTQDWSKTTYRFVADSTDTTVTFADTGIPDTYGTLLDGIFMSLVSNN